MWPAAEIDESALPVKGDRIVLHLLEELDLVDFSPVP